MGGDSGNIYQARAILASRKDPDREYRGLSRAEIDARVKKQASHLTRKAHYLTLKNGKRLKFYISDKNIEHLVSDAGGRAKGALNISDIQKLDASFSKAVHVNSADDIKKVGSGIKYHYFRTKVTRKTIFLNIKEDKRKRRVELHSITKEIR